MNDIKTQNTDVYAGIIDLDSNDDAMMPPPVRGIVEKPVTLEQVETILDGGPENIPENEDPSPDTGSDTPPEGNTTDTPESTPEPDLEDSEIDTPSDQIDDDDIPLSESDVVVDEVTPPVGMGYTPYVPTQHDMLLSTFGEYMTSKGYAYDGTESLTPAHTPSTLKSHLIFDVERGTAVLFMCVDVRSDLADSLSCKFRVYEIMANQMAEEYTTNAAKRVVFDATLDVYAKMAQDELKGKDIRQIPIVWLPMPKGALDSIRPEVYTSINILHYAWVKYAEHLGINKDPITGIVLGAGNPTYKGVMDDVSGLSTVVDPEDGDYYIVLKGHIHHSDREAWMYLKEYDVFKYVVPTKSDSFRVCMFDDARIHFSCTINLHDSRSYPDSEDYTANHNTLSIAELKDMSTVRDTSDDMILERITEVYELLWKSLITSGSVPTTSDGKVIEPAVWHHPHVELPVTLIAYGDRTVLLFHPLIDSIPEDINAAKYLGISTTSCARNYNTTAPRLRTQTIRTKESIVQLAIDDGLNPSVVDEIWAPITSSEMSDIELGVVVTHIFNALVITGTLPEAKKYATDPAVATVTDDDDIPLFDSDVEELPSPTVAEVEQVPSVQEPIALEEPQAVQEAKVPRTDFDNRISISTQYAIRRISRRVQGFSIRSIDKYVHEHLRAPMSSNAEYLNIAGHIEFKANILRKRIHAGMWDEGGSFMNSGFASIITDEFGGALMPLLCRHDSAVTNGTHALMTIDKGYHIILGVRVNNEIGLAIYRIANIDSFDPRGSQRTVNVSANIVGVYYDNVFTTFKFNPLGHDGVLPISTTTDGKTTMEMDEEVAKSLLAMPENAWIHMDHEAIKATINRLHTEDTYSPAYVRVFTPRRFNQKDISSIRNLCDSKTPVVYDTSHPFHEFISELKDTGDRQHRTAVYTVLSKTQDGEVKCRYYGVKIARHDSSADTVVDVPFVYEQGILPSTGTFTFLDDPYNHIDMETIRSDVFASNTYIAASNCIGYLNNDKIVV